MKKITILLSKVLNFSLGKAKQTVSVTILSLLLVSTSSFATPFTNLFVFGDSLSDLGSLDHLPDPFPSFCPPPPYSNCRFSNGPVWAELVAAELGVSAVSGYAGGTNFAIGGQTTEQVLAGQIPFFTAALNGAAADADALYVIWAGGNDFLDNTIATPFDPIDAVDNIITSILALQALGAVDFLIPNLPILFDPWADMFNEELAKALDGLGSPLNITQLDVLSTFKDIIFNPLDHGFTIVSTPCFDGVNLPCANPDDYLLWDPVHPTAAGHRAIAAAALSALHVSAPATIAIFSLGLVALVRARRKKLD